MTDLPGHWRRESLADLAADGVFVDGDWVESKDQDPAGSVRLTQLADVGVATFRDRSDRWMREDQARALGCTRLRPGDILIARMPDPIGRACLVPDNIGAAVTAVDVAILRLTRPDVDARYVMWAINGPAFYQSVVALESGTTRKRISRRNLSQLQLPVPPLEEQRRIIDLLEDHLSRLDAADAALGAAKRRLVALEQTILAGIYARGVPEPLGELAEIQGGIQKQPKRTPIDNAFPFLRVANVTSAGLDLGDVHSIELFPGELEKLRLRPGDLLVVEGNGSASQIGRAAIWDGSIEDCVHQNHLIRVRASETVSPTYLEAVWNSPQNRRELTELASSTSGLHTLSVSKLKRLKIPLLPPDEQDAAVATVAEIRAARGRLQEALLTATTRSGGLRRALLAAAFSGQLTTHLALEASVV